VTEPLPFSPYKGLMPFDDSERDALLFFGREREREIAAANLVASRLTVLYGPSGVGKSSLLRAGVVHELRAQARRNLEERGLPELAVVAYSSWRDDPVGGLESVVAAEVHDLTGAAGDGSDARLVDVLATAAERVGGELYVILDQFDEYFLYHADEAGPTTFAEQFPEAVNRTGLPVHVLIGIREDALAKLDAFKGSIPNLFGNYLRLDRLDEQAARAAIVGPIDRLNRISGNGDYDVEQALVGSVIAQVAVGRIDPGLAGRGVVEGSKEVGRVEAPYLQLVLQRVWNVETEAGSRTLRVATLDDLGGAERIVQDHLERALSGLDPGQKDVAARIFGHLVTPSGTKIAHDLGDLARYAGVDEAELEKVLRVLAEERILRPLAGEGADGRRYEIFHDVLAAAVLAWTTRYESERMLEEERLAARRRHRRVVLVAGIALAALAATTAIAVYALAQRSHARTQARHARARATEATALAQLSVDPRKSLQLAVDGAHLDPTSQAADVLRRALLASYERAVLRTGGPVTAAAVSPDGRRAVVAGGDGSRLLDAATLRVRRVLERGAVNGAWFSPDGKTLVTAGQDGSARLWDASTGAPLRAFRHAGPVLGASFGGGRLATASDDGTARVWNLRSGRLERLWKHPGPVHAAVLNPRGTLLATVAEDPKGHVRARLFDVRTGRLVREFPERGVTGVVFSPDGRLLVTTSKDKTARVRDVARLRVLHTLPHLGHVNTAAFSRDGKQLVTASDDGAARVWDVASGTRLLLLVGPVGHMETASFSSDGQFIVTSNTDHTAQVWEADNGRQLVDLLGDTDAVTSAVFSPDGASVVTAGADGTARLWAPALADQTWASGVFQKANLVPLPHLPAARSSVRAEFSRDGRLVLATDAGASRVWRPGGHVVSISRGTGAPFASSSLSPDGRRAVTVDGDGTTRIWSVATGKPLLVLRGSGPPGGVTFSPDGRLVLTWSADHAARLWAADSGRMLHVLRQPSPVTDAAFSPDGRLVVTAGGDGSAVLWSVRTARLLHRVVGHKGPIVHAVFSPDSRLVLTAGDDATARLWSVSSGATVHVLHGHVKGVTDAEFSPDGRRVLTTSHDGTAVIWDVATGARLHALAGSYQDLTGGSFSPDGRWVVVAGQHYALLFGANTGRLLFYLFGHATRDASGHAVFLTNASFSPDGRHVLTSSGDGTVRTFDCTICEPLQGLVALADSRLGDLTG
jgi:WD40 repeat protein